MPYKIKRALDEITFRNEIVTNEEYAIKIIGGTLTDVSFGNFSDNIVRGFLAGLLWVFRIGHLYTTSPLPTK
ncbi:MAG: hypothetical protein IPN22_09500 [Bacteroidetes bacterium]|nr:hypothetical protein [Bacteroidota bacterium]